MKWNKRYHYKGPLFDGFGKWITNFECYTMAPTEGRALSNVSYQAKKYLGLLPNAKIFLDDTDLKIVKNEQPVRTYHQMELSEFMDMRC